MSNSSIPLSELTKLNNNSEWQKNIQTMEQVLINVQKGLTNFFNSPEVQNTLLALQAATKALNTYLNDPKVRKNLEQLHQAILEIVNTESFQEKYNQSTKQTNNFEDELSNLEDMIADEININEQFPFLENREDRNKIISLILNTILIVYSCYFSQLDKFEDFQEAYVFYINNIKSKAVTISRVNLRKSPNFQSEAILTIPKDSLMKLYEENNNGWVKVSINLNNLDVEGYVSEAYIKRIE